MNHSLKNNQNSITNQRYEQIKSQKLHRIRLWQGVETWCLVIAWDDEDDDSFHPTFCHLCKNGEHAGFELLKYIDGNQISYKGQTLYPCSSAEEAEAFLTEYTRRIDYKIASA